MNCYCEWSCSHYPLKIGWHPDIQYWVGCWYSIIHTSNTTPSLYSITNKLYQYIYIYINIYIYIYITTITNKQVTAKNESVVIILVGKDGYRHDTKSNSIIINIPIHYCRFIDVPIPSYITNNSSRRWRRREAIFLCTIPIVSPYSI